MELLHGPQQCISCNAATFLFVFSELIKKGVKPGLKPTSEFVSENDRCYSPSANYTTL
jgi:hypothetical protein